MEPLKAPFLHVVERTKNRDIYLRDMQTGMAKPALFAMYLSMGEFAPEQSKRTKGWSFGFCDAAGNYLPDETKATHIGWTFDEERT